jgi:hypothetical protein
MRQEPSIYRAKALEHYYNRTQETVALNSFSRRLIVSLWILMALLCAGGAWIAWYMSRSLSHG